MKIKSNNLFLFVVIKLFLVSRKYYYPYIISYYIRKLKISYWFKDLSFIIIDFIIQNIKKKYYKYIDFDMLKNVDQKQFFRDIQEVRSIFSE